MIDYLELKIRIIRMYGSLTKFCDETGVNRSQLTNTIKHGLPMRAETIFRLVELLGISEDEVGGYFFRKKSCENNAE